MEFLADPVSLSRLQFALTALFHILWPVLSIGLSWFIVLLEALWLKTGHAAYYHHARFWTRLFILNFGVGVVSGVPLEFQFGTNWAPFSIATGDFFGNILGFEAAMAFMLEAGFLGVMVFGWGRVSPGMHVFASLMVAVGASLSAFWIMVANAWMQTPAGVRLENGIYMVESYWEAIFNPSMPWSVAHMWLASIETSLIVIGGVSAWYLLRGQQVSFFLRSFKLAIGAALIVAPLQIAVGDGTGKNVFEHQPAKAAALEGHWQTNRDGEAAPWVVLAWPDAARQDNRWSLEIPWILSWLATGSYHGKVLGLTDFPREDQPPAIPLLFYSFRFMVFAGFAILALMIWSIWAWHRGALSAAQVIRQRTLLRSWMLAIPLAYLAVECGWLVREIGRQPWLVYGLMRTRDGASILDSSTVAASLLAYALAYLLIFIAFLYFAHRLLRHGADESLTPPDLARRPRRNRLPTG